MQRLTFALAAILLLGCLASAQAATEVKMVGDFRVYGNWWSNRNFTGWRNQYKENIAAGTRTEDSFGVMQRFRLRTDFVANEALKFRLGIRVNNQCWGRGTLTADAPAVEIQVYQAFLQFKWPDTDIQFTIGQQPLALPQSGYWDGSLVYEGPAAALVVRAPLIPDTLSLMAGYSRFYDNGQWDDTTIQVGNEMDLFFLALPITLDGCSITPWSALAVAGRSAAYNRETAWNLTSAGSNGMWGAWATQMRADNLAAYNRAVAGGLVPAAVRPMYTQAFAQAAQDIAKKRMWENNQNTYWWLGGAIEVDALDPLKFYADVMYGQGCMSDRSSSKRQGWFIDAAIEYTGWDVLTPSVFGWWSSGEDGDWTNGSERMPYSKSAWNGGTSFLFDGDQDFNADGSMYMNPVGTWGLGASLKNISFIDKLTHRLTVAYTRGTNSSKAFRAMNLSYVEILNNATAVALTGAAITPAYYGVDYSYPSYESNGLFIMGRDLTADEYVIGVSFDHKYMIYQNLAAILETGYAHGSFQKSVWGPRLVNKAADAWRVALGLQYKF